MPPPIAMFLCTMLVIFLLWIERKQFPQASHALWIPTIWMFLNFSKPLGIWFSFGGESMESGSPLDRVFLTGILFLGLLIILRRQIRLSVLIKNNCWVSLFIVYTFISILWSDIPYISFKRWMRELVAICMVFLVATEVDPRQAMLSLFRRIIYISIPLSLTLIKYYPHLGVDYGRWSGNLMWTGVALQKNGLAFLCCFAIFLFVWTFVRRYLGRDIPVVKYQTQVEFSIFVLTIYLFTGPQHTLAYSATSTCTLIIGFAAFTGLMWMKGRGRVISAKGLGLIVTLVIMYGTITPFLGKLTLFDVSSTFGRSEDLTGRSEIWDILRPYAMERPILGHGFGGFWTDAIRELVPSHAHNAYLDIILNTGFVGLIMFSILLLSFCWMARSEMLWDFDRGILFCCFLIMAVTHNIAESSTTSITSAFCVILLLFAVSSNYNDFNKGQLFSADIEDLSKLNKLAGHIC